MRRKGDFAEIAEKDSANGKNNVFCYFATNRLRKQPGQNSHS